MLNNKTNSATSHSKTKAFTDPDLYDKSATLAFGPPTPYNTPNSSYGTLPVKFYISSSASSSTSDSNEAIKSTVQRRYTL